LDDEFIKRALTVQKNLLEGVYEHCHLAVYNLNAHAIKTHKRKLLKSQDMKEVKRIVSEKWPISNSIPHVRIVDKLPPKCLEFLKEYPVAAWKVEWMFNGGYDFQMNDLYKGRYQKFSRNKERGVYTKLWDTMGFSKIDVGLKLWIESLYRPDRIIRYEGNAYLIDVKAVKFQTARMMTHVYDYDHIVSVTVITL
jgi:hypothetical protein